MKRSQMDEVRNLSIKPLGAVIEEFTDMETRKIFEGKVLVYRV